MSETGAAGVCWHGQLCDGLTSDCWPDHPAEIENLTVLAARLFLADPDRPGPGPWEALPEGHRRPYLAMAQAASDYCRGVHRG